MMPSAIGSNQARQGGCQVDVLGSIGERMVDLRMGVGVVY